MNKIKHEILDFLPELDNNDIYNLIYDFYKNTEEVDFYDVKLKSFTKKWSNFYKDEKIIIFVKYILFDIEKKLPDKYEIVLLWGNNFKEYILSLNEILNDSVKFLKCGLELSESIPELSRNISNLKQSLLDIYLFDIFRLYDAIELPCSKDLGYFLGKSKKPTKNLILMDLYLEILAKLIPKIKHIQYQLKKIDFKLVVGLGSNNPHMGLLFGFLRVYKHIQTQVNNLPKRHLDYYFRKILNQNESDSTPDKVYLFFRLMPTEDGCLLPKGSLFNTGEDSFGNSRYFKIDRDVHIHNSKITELRKIIFSSDKSIVPRSKKKVVTDIYVENINSEEINNKGNKWNLFEIGNSHKHNGFGWVLAASFFKSSSSYQKFSVSFTFEDKTAKECKDKIKSLALELNVTTDKLGFHFFKESILLKISTVNSWFELERFDVNYKMFLDDESNEISFTFELTEDLPKWIPFDKEIHKMEYDTKFPVLDFTLDESSVYFPYSLLKDLIVSEIHLSVEVKKCDNLIFYNKHGSVDNTKPFPIFGINPIKDNYFKLKVPEWENQYLREITCHIEWFDIYQPNFETYYEGYSNKELTDSNFKVSLDSEILPLFSIYQDKIQPNTVWRAVIKEGVSHPENSNGFLKVFLSSPSVGFGDMIYLDEIMYFNKKLLNFKKNKEIPSIIKKPYTPIVKKLTIDYTASQFIDLKNKNNFMYDFIHKHPLGNHKVGNQNTSTLLELLPVEITSSTLFIGLEDVKKNTSLTIFFNIKYIGNTSDKPIEILYLCGSFWKLLPIDHIIQNTTENFTVSGILQLIIPEDIESNYQWLDKNKQWIKFVNQNELDFLRTCYYIGTNVGLATRVQDKKIEFGHISSHTITELVVKNKKIQEIIQPFSSFGGKSSDTEGILYNKVSHLLRHKNRAIRIEDIYNLVVDNFAEVNYVKCLTPVLYPKLVPKGEIHILINYNTGNNYIHSFSPIEVNKRIKSFLLEKCLLGTKIEVFNPGIEVIEVIISIDFEKGIGFPKKSIQKRIDTYIAPWLYSEESNHFKTKLTISELIKIVSQEPGVIGINNCRIIQIKGNNKQYEYFESKDDDEIIKVFSPKDIFIPSKHHQIKCFVEDKGIGVGNMVIGQDFILQKIQKEGEKEYKKTKSNSVQPIMDNRIKKIDLKDF